MSLILVELFESIKTILICFPYFFNCFCRVASCHIYLVVVSSLGRNAVWWVRRGWTSRQIWHVHCSNFWVFSRKVRIWAHIKLLMRILLQMAWSMELWSAIFRSINTWRFRIYLSDCFEAHSRSRRLLRIVEIVKSWYHVSEMELPTHVFPFAIIGHLSLLAIVFPQSFDFIEGLSPFSLRIFSQFY